MNEKNLLDYVKTYEGCSLSFVEKKIMKELQKKLHSELLELIDNGKIVASNEYKLYVHA